MKKFYFRKTTQYYSGKDKNLVKRFEFLSKLTLQKIDPRPLHEFKNTKKDVLIICSPLKRVYLSFTKSKNITVDVNLKEVLFDLRKFTNPKEFKKEGSVIIRKKFKEFFISDTLPEKRKTLFKDIKLFLKSINKIKDREIMVISHSFKLKLIEAYIKTNGEIENNPKLIHKFIKNGDKTYDFEEGFDILA